MRLPHASAYRHLCSLLTALVGLLPLSILSAEEQGSRSGRDLFRRQWQVNDPLCPKGDGLGPVFNATSCATCHHQGGNGGGGDLQFNVELLTLMTSPEKFRVAANRRSPEQLRLHPDFLEDQATIVLHRFGIHSDYEPYRFGMLGKRYSHDMSPAERARFWASIAKSERQAPAVYEFAVEGLSFQLSQRNTPTLFGAGLIDAIEAEQIRALEEQQARAGTAISGRVAPAKPSHPRPFDDNDTRSEPESVGRFGWRGQTATLADFVLGACANELGLETPGHKQPVNALATTDRPSGLDLEEQQCKDLIQFVRFLPRPVQIKPSDPGRLQRVERGEKLFHRIGCVDCHVMTVGEVEGLYSDLLLHDMGSELADPVPAMPATIVVGQQQARFGYFGAAVDILAKVPSNTRQEWRTPPLWGVADSAPYLHDGRARSLGQAIMLHGGEAAGSREEFAGLTGPDRESLFSFLMTLRSPQ